MYKLTEEEIGRDRTDNKISDKLHGKKKYFWRVL